MTWVWIPSRRAGRLPGRWKPSRRGDLTLDDTGGIELEWGDMDTVINKVLPADFPAGG